MPNPDVNVKSGCFGIELSTMLIVCLSHVASPHTKYNLVEKQRTCCFSCDWYGRKFAHKFEVKLVSVLLNILEPAFYGD
jgi:hypothetical protein